MKGQFIRDLSVGYQVLDFFLVKHKEYDTLLQRYLYAGREEL